MSTSHQIHALGSPDADRVQTAAIDLRNAVVSGGVLLSAGQVARIATRTARLESRASEATGTDRELLESAAALCWAVLDHVAADALTSDDDARDVLREEYDLAKTAILAVRDDEARGALLARRRSVMGQAEPAYPTTTIRALRSIREDARAAGESEATNHAGEPRIAKRNIA